MHEVLRRWLRELRALGARPPPGALEELLRAPSLPEQAVQYLHLRRAEGVHTADVVRELGALARVIGPDPRVLEAMARVAAEGPPAPALEEALSLLSEGLVVVDADGAVTLQAGPRPWPPELAQRALSTGKPQRARVENLESEARPLYQGGALRGAAQVFRDRSEIARLETELQRADRELSALQARLVRSGHLQAMVDVAAGTALALNHELNAIALALPLLRAAHDDVERERRLASVEAALRRAASLVDRVQQLAAPRRGTPPRPVDLNQVLMEALDLVRPELTAAADARRVRVDARLGKLGPVLAAPSSLRELLSSLLVQARDALGGGGLLTVRTRADGDHGEVELRHALASVEQQVLGELALEGARQIAAGAQISSHREGTEQVLRIRLPLAEVRPAPAPAVTQARRLLIVDDDPDNREALGELLTLLGHEVTAVGGAREALQLVPERAFDAALLDFAMPEMNGIELARRLRVLAPRLKLALVTGWEEPAAAAGDVDAVFRKPLDVPALEAFLGDEITTGSSPTAR
jgi:two-component system, cell cycle sensor histidine kinase and response regulator CckA